MEAHHKEQNTLFKGEYALSNSDAYEKYYDEEEIKAANAGEADVGSDLDSEAESHIESLSMI